MAGKSSGDFEFWLVELLDSANVDGEIYASYISGTLQTLEGSSLSEIEEALADILSACLEDEASCTSVSKQVAQHWQERSEAKKEEESQSKVDAAMERLFPLQPAQDSSEVSTSGASGSSKQQTGRGLSAEEKYQLVAQYDCGYSDEEEDDESKPDGGLKGIFTNLNAAEVVKAQRQRKVLEKASHEARLERERTSREVQKQKEQDRKEKEKKRTQKQERRR